MKKKIKIGTEKSCRIKLSENDCPNICAEIFYDKGYWLLRNLIESESVFVNNEKITEDRILDKYDKIQICGQIIHWSNYLYEGDQQELTIKDFKSINGRLSRSNFRALTLLLIGATICVFFIPGIVVAFWKYFNRRKFRSIEFDTIETIESIAPIVYSIGFGLITILLILISIKRFRDTGETTWKILIPIYNLKILFFDKSMK